MPSYLIGVDIGGTFTDCVIIDNEGQVTTAKVPSTPADFSRGMVNAVHAGADALGVNLEVLYLKARKPMNMLMLCVMI